MADYSHRFQDALAGLGHRIDFFDSLTALRELPLEKFARAMSRLDEVLADCDLVHLQHEYRLVPAAQAPALGHCLRQFSTQGGAVVATLHTAPRRPWHWRLARRISPRNWRALMIASQTSALTALAGLDVYLLHTAAGCRALRRLAPFRRADIRVLPHPIAPRAPSAGTTAKADWVRNELNQQAGDVLVALPGFLTKEKGHEPMLAALARLPPRFKLIIAGGLHPDYGDAGYLHALLQRVEDLGLHGRVCITGYLSEVEMTAIIGRCDLAVFPYERAYASASGVIGLALAAGKCAVVSRTDGFVELSRRTKGLVVCRSNTPVALAAAVRRTTTQPPLSASEIISAAEQLSYSAIARQLEREVYRPLVARRKQPRLPSSALR